MTKGTDAEVAEADRIAGRRDELVSRVTAHAGTIARELALLQGGDYGRAAFRTDAGTWTLKYEAGDVEYLRFEASGRETYVVSTKRPPEPDALATAMADYDAFVEAFNRHVASLDGVLDGVSTDFPEVASTDAVVAERDRVVERVRAVGDAMAGELSRYDGTDYGTFSTTVAGTRWELKRDGNRASYLRVGGEGGTYLLSQYEPPSAPDLRTYVDDVPAFVEAFNEHVGALDADLSRISLRGERE
ncbi:hypothetical protein ACFQPA_15250 [Halomarina halobia]|uniref:Profilin fold domain-containing protein n=1 Tax=Halomarina halobia TaxID=3033386 RepID=A0ABD6A7L8_9EURY|nr:hypothetical protein [Halomarina sp. PSR21]